MTKFFLLFFLPLFLFSNSFAQTGRDSVADKKDSVPVQLQPVSKDTPVKSAISRNDELKEKKDSSVIAGIDSISIKNEKLSDQDAIIMYKKVLENNPYFNFTGKPLAESIEIHKVKSYDILFYLLLGIFFYFALIKLLFRKYLDNLFTLFFRVSMRQQQIREQVLQAPLPSLLLNILFIITGGLYACFLIRYFHLGEKIQFWLLFINCSAVLIIIYLSKFLILKLSGWTFSITRATDMYIFIIFLASKILGIFLLPFLVVLSFSGPLSEEIAVTASLVMIFVFFIYRFIASYGSIRNEIKVSGFHFFLYLCAFEIAPLLLIYKVLLTYLEKAY